MTTEQTAKTLLEIADFLKRKDDTAKPEPAFTLPPCAPGMEWHRPDGWKPEDLPQGWRPLVRDEEEQPDDEQLIGQWERNGDIHEYMAHAQRDWSLHRRNWSLHRTRRPLIFTHAGKQWTWHRPGDPMPCDPERKVEVILVKRNPPFVKFGSTWCWDDIGDDSIIGWRYADEKKTVPLSRSDILPCSVITGLDGGWSIITSVGENGVGIDGRENLVPWDELYQFAKINRSLPLIGKWDADAWEPCSKEVEA